MSRLCSIVQKSHASLADTASWSRLRGCSRATSPNLTNLQGCLDNTRHLGYIHTLHKYLQIGNLEEKKKAPQGRLEGRGGWAKGGRKTWAPKNMRELSAHMNRKLQDGGFFPPFLSAFPYCAHPISPIAHLHLPSPRFTKLYLCFYVTTQIGTYLGR